ncbi:MAG: hypothetical protein ABSH32_03685 [Bryobacteraceae bacterium]
MRYFPGRRIPPASRIPLVESGSRHLLERVSPALRKICGDSVPVDLVTCCGGG